MKAISALQIREAFVLGKVSAQEITEYFLKRIQKHGKKLGAFLEIFEEKALAKAKELDIKRGKKQPLGKLAAIPIAVKDNIHIQGERTSCASKFLANYIAPFSSTAVRLLAEEDAIFIAKTNMDEFAMGSSTETSAFFPCRNPWNLNCSPGGSSGGSAAAVAARLVPIALGSDTGGSVRQPAAFCGIVGFKPTYGRVSRYGLVAFGSSFDQIGPLTTNTMDTALIMEILGHPCQKDATSIDLIPESYHLREDCKGLTIGVPWNFLKELQTEVAQNFQTAIEQLKSLGATIIDIDLDFLKYGIATYYILSTAEASTNLARFDGIRYGIRYRDSKTLEDVYDLSREEGFGKEVKKRIMLGTYVLSSGFKDAYYKKAQKVRTLILKNYEQAFEKCDLIAMPTASTSAFALSSIQDPLQMYLQDIFTVTANLAGLPAISLPSGFDKDNKPLALQLIGPQMHDVNVVQYAHAYEKAAGFSNHISPFFNNE